MAQITSHIPVSPAPADFRAAFGTAAGIQGWWAQNATFEGDRIHLLFHKGDVVVNMHFTLDRVDDEVVQWTCTENLNPVWPGTTLTWTRTASGIDFAHAGFAEDQSPPFKMTAEGWKPFFASLESWLRTGQGQPMA